jgi:hypothetical protein
LGQDIIALPFFPRSYGGTGFEAEAVVSSFQNVAAVGGNPPIFGGVRL